MLDALFGLFVLKNGEIYDSVQKYENPDSQIIRKCVKTWESMSKP